MEDSHVGGFDNAKNDTSIPRTSNIGGQYYSYTPNPIKKPMHVYLVLQT